MFTPQGANPMLDRPLWHNGPRPGAFYSFPNNQLESNQTGGAMSGIQRSS